LVVDTLLQQAGRKLLGFHALPRFGRPEQQSLPDCGEEQFGGGIVVDAGAKRIMEPGPEALLRSQAAQESVGGGTPVIAARRFDDRRERATARDTPQERGEYGSANREPHRVVDLWKGLRHRVASPRCHECQWRARCSLLPPDAPALARGGFEELQGHTEYFAPGIPVARVQPGRRLALWAGHHMPRRTARCGLTTEAVREGPATHSM